MPHGISAGAILKFLDALEGKGVQMHGFLLRQGGRKAAEGYWKPYTAATAHRLFSVAKSMTSLAIGILAGEGKLCLDDPIARYFPDYLPDPLPGQIARMTIRDMLRMATAHRFTTYKLTMDDNWARTFFTVPPTKEPGAVFAYDTSSPHTLAALVQRLTGQNLLAFLRERLFLPLGCEGAMRWLTDPSGVCQGGSGLVMTLPDFSRVAACLLRGGDGLIPADYLREATSKQIDTDMQGGREERYGYGYQFWRLRESGWAMYGMGGQLALALPEKDLLLCTIGDTRLNPSGVESIHDALWECIVPAGQEDAPDDLRRLSERLQVLSLPALPHCPGASLPTGQWQMDANNPLGLQRVYVSPDALTLTYPQETITFPLPLGSFAESADTGLGEPCFITAGLDAAGRLRLNSHGLGDNPSQIEIALILRGDALTLQARSAAEPALPGFSGIASGVRL
ncbi:MAG: beta-lactamase family protein [Oscillospiraceae bacterium]|jgi:CubicO group peptidase (beta-lactamase class C family)|nr:beta-lactamase family protein [Oscillospiraceae bacterium]